MAQQVERLKAALADRYTIQEELGAGGMATVYLAEDLKHHRKVAVKVLRPELAAILGAERFLKEIEVTANLQHPHILPLFDSGEADSFLYYVMPYVEGDSLRDKLNREKQLGVDETVKIAEGVAAAMAYAHRQGVIHRDIKPENILIHDGQPVVADFGIALAVTTAGGTRLTETGLSLGTPQYMSPEQATGDRELDGRSDIYSLGCVLYEMLTGDPPHTGSTAQAVIAKVVTDKPRRVTELRDTVPPHVEHAVHKALKKLPADRFASASAFAEALTGSSAVGTLELAAPTMPRGGLQRLRTWLPWSLTFALGIYALYATFGPARADPPRLVVTTVLPPEGLEFQGGLALSPDGQQLVFRASGSENRLFVRRLDDPDPKPLEGTEGAGGPFWSPDGARIGFFADGSLKWVPSEGGIAQTIAPVEQGYGGTWNRDGIILFAPAFQGRPIFQVSASGDAAPTPVTRLDSSHVGHVLPFFLPDGRHFFFGDGNPGPSQGIFVGDLETGRQAKIRDSGGQPKYSPPGYVLFQEQNVLYAQAFDPTSQVFSGGSQPIARIQTPLGWGRYTASQNGVLAFRGVQPGDRPLIVTDRQGEIMDSIGARGVTFGWSHDSRQVAFGGRDGLFVRDSERRITRLRTPSSQVAWAPVWSPGDSIIAYGAFTAGRPFQLWSARTDGSQPATKLVDLGAGLTLLNDWSPDGRYILLNRGQLDTATGSEVWTLDVKTSEVELLLSVDGANLGAAKVSPDGRWIAYTSDETGVNEIYVAPFRASGPAMPVSVGGGILPRWRADGRELYYASAGRIMAVRVGQGASLTFSQPEVLIPINDLPSLSQVIVTTEYHLLLGTYEVSADGNTFLFATGSDQQSEPITLMQNWVAWLAPGR